MEKQILDLKAERAQLDTYFEEISKRSDLSQEDKDIFEQKESRAQQIDEEIQKMEKQLLFYQIDIQMKIIFLFLVYWFVLDFIII